MRGQYIADTPIKALHHSVGLRVAWANKAVLNMMLCTSNVEGVMASWLALASRSEPIREALAIICQHLSNLERCLTDKPMEKGASIAC